MKKNYKSFFRSVPWLICLMMMGTGTLALAQTYVSVNVTGYDADIIANGTGPASGSTTADADGSGYALVAQDFSYNGNTPAAYLPNGGVINSANTTGLTFQLGNYSGNNSLQLVQSDNSGTLIFTTPKRAQVVYVLGTTGNGSGSGATATFTVYFADGTSQQITNVNYPDWTVASTGQAIVGIGNVNISTNVTAGSSSGHRLFERPLNIDSGNYNKSIDSISVHATNLPLTNSVLNIMGISIRVPNSISCSEPTTLASSNITTSGADVSWIESGSATKWQVEYGPVGFTLGTGTQEIVNNTPSLSLSSLLPATNYHVFVRAICGAGDTSDYAGPLLIGIPCDGQPAAGTVSSDQTSVCASTDIHLTLTGAAAATSGISYHWQSAAGAGGPWTDITGNSTAITVTGQTAATYYRAWVACSGSGLADTTAAVLVDQNAPNQCYCVPSANSAYNTYYITSFDAAGQGSAIANDNTGFSTNGYGDYANSMTVEAIPTLDVDFSIATNAGANVKIYVDWNQDGDFDDNGEEVYAATGTYTTTSFSGTFTVPATAVQGQTRMRVRSNNYYTSISSACGNTSYGESEDYTLNVVPPTGCIIPSDLTVSNLHNTYATLSWNAPVVGDAPQGYGYEIRSSGAAGSGSTGLVNADSAIAGTSVMLSGLQPGATYMAYARTECDSDSRSAWTGGVSFTLPLYVPVALNGFNADVIANSIGSASSSTNNDVDGVSYALVAQDFKGSPSGASPTQFLPNGGVISKDTKVFQLADYSADNSLRLDGSGQSGTLNFLTPKRAMKVYVLGVSGSGVSSLNATVQFADGSAQAVTGQSWPDWFQAGSGDDIVASEVGRVNISNNDLGTGGPDLVENMITIDSANFGKPITGIDFTTGSGSHVMNILAVSILPDSNPSCTTPVALQLDSVSAHTAIVSWGGPATNYQISYAAPGVLADSGTMVNVSATSDTLTGLASATAYNVFVRSNCAAGNYSDWVGPLSVQTLLESCTGTPAAGTIASTAVSVCPDDPFTLTAAGATVAYGVTYMWQSSVHGANTWDTLASTTNTLSVTSQSDTTDYRFIVFCSYSGQSDTALFTEIQNPPTDCYCTPSASYSGYYITSFNTSSAGVNNNIVNDNTGLSAGYYTDYSDSLIADGIQTDSVNFSVETSSGAAIKVYVDWNQDGDFDDNGEEVYAYTGNYNTTTYAGSFTVPATALTGHTRMRVRSEGYFYTISGPCANTNYGETEDYALNVVPLTPCAGMPVPGNTIADDTSFCVTGSTNLSLENNFAGISGMAFQWQQNASGAWDDIIGDTLMMANSGTLTGTTQFRCRLICVNSGDTAWSNPVTITIHPLPSVTVSPETATFCGSSPVTLTASGATSYVWTPTDSLSVDTGAIVTANPSALTQYTVVGTDVYGCSASATASVGPVNAIQLATSVTYAGACSSGNPVTVSVGQVSVVSGNMEYQFTDTAGNVLKAWSSDTFYTTTPASDGVYTYWVYGRSTACPNDSTVNPGIAVASVGFTGTVVAADADCSGNANGSITVDSVTGPGAGGVGLTWYSNDFSSAALDPSQAALDGSAAIANNGCRLTQAVGNQRGALTIKNPNGINPTSLNVSFTLSTSQSGADGISYNYGDDANYIANNATLPNVEAGATTKLAVGFDAYGSSGAGVAGIYLVYGRDLSNTNDMSTTDPAVLAYSPNTSWRNNGTVPVNIVIDNAGKITVTVNGTVIFDHVQLPAAYMDADKSTWKHLFFARTGGSSEEHVLDDLNITYGNTVYNYGLNAGGSGNLPATWQTSNTFNNLTPGDSFDVWVANPTDNLNCNKFLGTYKIGAPTFIAPAPQYTLGQQNCGADDATLTIQVDSAGTYGVRYRLNGDTTFMWQNSIATINDGTADFIAISNLAPGIYTDISAFKGNDTCFSNMLTGPVSLEPVVNGIAMTSSADSMQQGSGLTLTYRNDNCEQIATVSSNADLGKVNANVVLDTVLYDASGAPYSGRYYVITPGQNNGQAATLTLYFSNDDIAAYNSAVAALNNPDYPAMDTTGANILISAYHGVSSVGTTGPGSMFDSASSDLITPSSIVDNGNYVAVTFTSVNGFSGFFAHTVTNTPLALTFGKVSATNAGERNVIQWNTLNEEAGNYFMVERSEDSRNFRQLGKVTGKGVASNYTFDDDQPLSGVNYYRIAMVALNGHTVYSKVVSARMNTARFNVMVYPNPARDALSVKVQGMANGGAKLLLMDATGRLLKKVDMKDKEAVISLNGLSQGLYLLQYEDNSNTRTIKINKL